MMTVTLWWTDENGSTLAPTPREGPFDEDEASSLTAWVQGYREVRKNMRDLVTGRGYYKPETSRFKKVVRKTVFEKKPPRRYRNVRSPFRDSERSQHRTYHWSRAEKMHSLQPLTTIWTYGESVRTQHRRTLSNLQPRISLSQEMLLHSCIICRLTCCSMVHPRLSWDATLI